MRMLGREFRFGNPELVDIVIFDETNSHLVRQALNAKHQVVVFNMRPVEIWLGFKITLGVLRLLSQRKLCPAPNHLRGLLIGVLKQLYCIYLESCLMSMKPKAVVTYIDNCSRFGWLSKNCRKFPFIAIQNGSRLSYAANKESSYYIQHLFCYGAHEVNLFPKLGYQVENFYPVGSLVASLHFNQQIMDFDQKYDLLIVSTWRGNIGFQQDVKDTMRGMKIMDQLLAKYIKSSGIKAAVILRSERDSADWIMPEVGMSEEGYYIDNYGDCIDLIETNFSKRNIFPLMQQSQVIISCLSSALMEAFGIGKKILYCNFTGVTQYHQDIDPLLITSDDRYESLAKKLDELLELTSIEYSQRHQDRQKYFMSYPECKLTYQAIAEKIDQIIKKVDPLNVQ